ncbi:hypothetical protein [Brevundimonas naejangsanensis]|uniref:hypothetical protein n=1 Tax=Brevundimonas naejangsanensis TaxID=588932 RepID=UPI0034D4679D
MPQALPVVASWAAAAWSSAVTATAVGLTKIGVMAAIGEGATIALAGAAVKTGAMIGLSVAAAALMRPNTPSSGTSLDFKPDPKAPVRGAMGYTALGGNKVFQATWGYKKVAMSLGVALSLGPIDQVPRFEADGATVSFSGPQNEATGFYAADMWQRTTLGLPGDAALLPPTGLKYGNPGLTGWGTQHAAPQTAFSFWTMVLAKNPEDRDVFTNGVPDPRWIGRWMKVWQPRYDSTYPGGSGPQRRDDWRTWGWSENPYDHALAWVRGHYKLNLDGSIDRTKRIAGIGAPDSAIDIPAFVEGANIADANGWTISGEWSTGDGKFQTLLAMLQAGGGEPISRGAQISVLVNAPRVSTYTYTRDDLIGQAEIRPLTPRRERKNTIIPRYKSEANGWQYVPAGEVTSSVYRDEDRGEPRSLEIEYTHVRNAKQAGQLAAYDLANLREGLTATLPSKVHLMHVHPGACITVDVPELALASQKFIVRRATTNHQAASVTLELRSESDGKHAWALGQAAQPAPSPSLSAVDPKYVPPPAAEDWTVLPKPPGDGGVSQPIFVIEAPVETTDIVAVIIKHGPSASGPWTDGYEGSPRADGRYEVAGLTPGQTYCVSLQYVAKNGAKSDPDIKCGIVAGDLIAGGLAPESPIWGQLNDLTKQALRTAIEAAQALLDEEQRRQIEVEDILDRLGLGFLLDPVTRTALIKSETVVQGVGPGGLPETLVQMSTRLVAADAANELNTAQAVISAEVLINALRSESNAKFATYNALDSAIAANALVIRSAVTAEIAQATVDLVSASQLGSAISNSELVMRTWTNGRIVESTAELMTRAEVTGAIGAADLNLRGWTNGRISEATADLVTKSFVEGGLAVAKGQWESYADNEISRATAGMDTVAAREAALAAAALTLKSWATDSFAGSEALLAVESEVSGAKSTANLALSAAHGNEAYAALTADSGGRLTSMRINGVTRAIDFLAETFNVTAEGGNGISYSAASKIFKIFGDGQKTLMKASGDVRFWSGPSTVPDGWETAENGVIALGPGVPGGGQFNGLTLSRPFDTGVGSDTAIVIQPDTWTVIAETSLHYMREGVFMTAASIEALVSSSTADGSVSWVVESVNAAGGDPVIVAQGGFLLPANIIPWTTGRSAYLPGLGRRTGERRLRFSIAWSNPPVTGVTIRKARLWGLYAAELTSWPN